MLEIDWNTSTILAEVFLLYYWTLFLLFTGVNVHLKK